jgi:threonine/homoserine/homoserine lactone efflux protein
VLKHLLLGGGFAFAAAIQPGPLQAFLVARAAATGWRRTVPACFSPLLSDGPIALVSLLLLNQLPQSSQSLLRAAGGLLLLYLAGVAFLQWRRPAGPVPGRSAPRTLLEATLVNLLNPNPYLGWSLVLGPAVLAAWRESSTCALALVAAFYGTMCFTLAALVLLAGSRFLGPRAQRALVAVSAAVLAGLGVSLLVGALTRLAAS